MSTRKHRHARKHKSRKGRLYQYGGSNESWDVPENEEMYNNMYNTLREKKQAFPQDVLLKSILDILILIHILHKLKNMTARNPDNQEIFLDLVGQAKDHMKHGVSHSTKIYLHAANIIGDYTNSIREEINRNGYWYGIGGIDHYIVGYINQSLTNFNNGNSNVNSNAVNANVNTAANYTTNNISFNEELTIPNNATNAITFESIHSGNHLVNFHNEASHGRYYKKNTFNELRPKKNPYTRRNIKKNTVRGYTAKK